MNYLSDIFSNKIIIAGFFAWLSAQIIKTVINAVINRRIDWWRLVGDGGMPSGHSATVTAVAVYCMLEYGAASYQFGIAAIIATIVCHDAMGVRLETGKQAKIINEIIRSFDILAKDTLPDVKLKELVGHTPIQVLFGILVGIVTALIIRLT